jgi:hypothetical protein
MAYHKRWTIKELTEMTDREFLIGILDERISHCTNPYAPLALRIGATRARLTAVLPDPRTSKAGREAIRKSLKSKGA